MTFIVSVMNKSARIDFSRCDPWICDRETGVCRAAAACKKGLLEQESRYDAPLLLSSRMCTGCYTCVRTCPLGAISVEGGL
jgi:translation initiation factor RLI1